jgi:IS30 family transposase
MLASSLEDEAEPMPRKRISGQRIERSARKLNRKVVLALSEKGLSTIDIARHQGVAPSTIFRFLQRAKPDQFAVKAFKGSRADVFARLQIKSLDAQERLLDSLTDDVLAALTPHQKSGLLHSLNAQAGTLYDKERLEVGKSTSNLSSLAQVMRQAFQDLAPPAGWIEGLSEEEDAALDDSSESVNP